MKTEETLELAPREEPESKALVVHQRQEVGHALSASQITEKLRFIKQVMRENMSEGTDYGKVPGCGDKPGLFQPGAQKLSMTFQLNPEVREETISEFPNFHRGYRLVVRVSNGSKFADGVGECSTLESKYRYRNAMQKCPTCGASSIYRSKKGPEKYYCWTKKGGCGLTFMANSENSKIIDAQETGKVENENPPDHWNTARKMAFKRAFVHAIINATNTSELWSQDLEDLAGNGIAPKPVQTSEAKQYGFTDTGEGTDLGPQKNFGARSAGDTPGAGQGYSAGHVRSAHAREGQQDAAANTERNRSQEPSRTVRNSNPVPTQRHKDRMLSRLIEVFGLQDKIKDFACDAGVLMETETLLDWPFRYVPATVEQMDALEKAVAWYLDGNKGTMPFVNAEPLAGGGADKKAVSGKLDSGKPASKPVEVPRDEHGDPDSPDAKWRAFPVPYGKHAGVQLGKLDKNVLWGFWQGHEVKPTFEGRDGKPVKKKHEQMKKDQAFRDVLDQAGLHYNFNQRRTNEH